MLTILFIKNSEVIITMCGIIGYIGTKNAVSLVLSGLKKLEYRGYDSAGIATISNKLVVKKDVGKIDEVFSKIDVSNIKSNIAIGHTRWATHGKVTKENAHPHTDCKNEIAIVHNGIIENFKELKEELIKKGHVFKSETDSEVIAHLIEEEMKNKDFVNAFFECLKKLKGSYAIVAIYEKEKKMVAARKESPLVVGVANHGFFISSDVPSFIDETKKVIYLYDGDVVVINNGLKIYNNGVEVKREIDSVEWDAEQAKKGVFKHFMLKEITEQANVIKKAIAQDDDIIKEIVDSMKNAEGIYFVGCGTAYHACLEGSYIFSKVAKLHVNVCYAHEFPNYVHFLTPKSLVIAISQSGETADTLTAIRAAKEKGAKVISIVNVAGSTLVRESHKVLLQHAGPEICVLSTKSYTSQLAILVLLAYAFVDKLDEAKSKLKELIRYIYYLTSKNTQDYIKKLAEILKDSKDIYILGRGLQYPTALEAALKIKEVSYIHAEGFAGGELKHGNIALIEKGTPCIVFTSKDTESDIISNAQELKSRGAYVIGIGPKNNDVFDFFIKVREAEEANSICQIIPIQILAYQLAILRGLDPDKPRNLAKSVTVK
ncbi:MAG: glutamine--fructose-6-phosphate transaminase (isomerizing) [Nanoarchaeota archaeon]|nr:glutamine--fructose-6-phosphate transaminase (isomerizing) [Nanoarchaeota archaeon]